jgi:Ca2+-binding EF-hand superfamily protein
MMKKSTGIVFVAACLFSGGAAFAAPDAGQHDGHDAHSQTAQKGGMRHHDEDGKSDRMAPMFGMMDENKDGKLSREEVQKSVDKMFADADANKDGVITKDEMRAHHNKMHDRMQSKMQERWKAADKDGDGALSRAEVDAADMTMLSRNFEKLDKNKDGKLTTDEMRSGMMPHRQPAPPQVK